MSMTIIRGISKDGDQEVPDFASHASVMNIGLARQRSLLNNLPDFPSLMEALNTPSFDSHGFNFSAEELSLEEEQNLSDQINFGSIEVTNNQSMYPETGAGGSSMASQVKGMRLVEVLPPPKALIASEKMNSSFYGEDELRQSSVESTPVGSPVWSGDSSQSSSLIDSGIDSETENATLPVVKTEISEMETNEQNTMEEITKKMDRCCRQLNIPRDPTLWTVQQVQQWICWIARECYNLDYLSPSQLQVDGTTLCMLRPEDFVARSEEMGQILSIELEIWRNAVFIETKARNEVLSAEYQHQQQQQQPNQFLQQQLAMQQQQFTTAAATSSQTVNTAAVPTTAVSNVLEISPLPVYTDLTNAAPPTMSYTITEIPTPVPMCVSTASHMTTTTTASHHHQDLTLNQLISHDLYASYHANQQHFGQEAGHQVSPVSCWEDSPDSLSPQYMMGEDEDSRASTPLVSIQQLTGGPTSGTPAKKRGPTGRRGYGAAVGHTKQTIHLWQFLRELLTTPNNYIRWVDQKKGVFKIEDSQRVATLWGQRKNRPAMNYDKLSRSIRQYYKKGIIKKTESSKRLVYQFCDGYL